MDPIFMRSNQELRRDEKRLPHCDAYGVSQMVTFGLIDSHPKKTLSILSKDMEGVEKLLDQGAGRCILRKTNLAHVVANSILHFHEIRYWVHAWVVMPNHVHVLLTLRPEITLWKAIHSWKSYSAHKINKTLGQSGAVWHADYFDRYIRNEEHFSSALNYIEENPVKAGLCATAADWRFSSAWKK